MADASCMVAVTTNSQKNSTAYLAILFSFSNSVKQLSDSSTEPS